MGCSTVSWFFPNLPRFVLFWKNLHLTSLLAKSRCLSIFASFIMCARSFLMWRRQLCLFIHISKTSDTVSRKDSKWYSSVAMNIFCGMMNQERAPIKTLFNVSSLISSRIASTKFPFFASLISDPYFPTPSMSAYWSSYTKYPYEYKVMSGGEWTYFRIVSCEKITFPMILNSSLLSSWMSSPWIDAPLPDIFRVMIPV